MKNLTPTLTPPALCPRCGKTHLSLDSVSQTWRDHHPFWMDCPTNPVDWLEEQVKLGLQSPSLFKTAQDQIEEEMRQALLVEKIAGNDPETALWVQELIRQAGGFDSAFRAAFGEQATQLAQDSQQRYPLSRRQFIQNLLIGAMLVTLANCGEAMLPEDEESLAQRRLEKTHLKIAFLPIACATPILMAQPLGFYEKHGLTVELVKMNSWPDLRDAAIAGELDAYHMLSPMPLAMSLGLGSPATAIRLASIENNNGNAIVVALRHRERITGPADFNGFRIAVPYIYSMHNLLLRYYLATGGVHPDREVEIVVASPMAALEELRNGSIDAMLVAEPFNQLAVDQNLGFIHLLSQELWTGHPCCSFTASKAWIDQYPSTFRAVNKAIIESAYYARQSQNRREAAQAVAGAEYLNVSLTALESVFTGQFEDGLGNRRNVPNRIDFDPYPWKSFSYWMTTQFKRWGFLADPNIDHEDLADEVFMTALARQLSKQLGQNPPTLIMRHEDLKYDRFDPTNPTEYLTRQVEQFGF
ncbi:ABC transporter substrate-binding protein [Spirulina subsalsa]|uniref:ABC transporter substrate-binding protein n=1 Tax=Spirulina subsalsa TaxID=54311 RepID=UPI0002FE07CA|nr:ABC transporter substrate-binding protein [Spirulina subsalsa]